MTQFQLSTYTGYRVTVEVYPTRKEFLKNFREKYGLKGSGGRACCFHYIDGKKRKNVGTVAFCAKDLNVGTIAHEFVHILTGIAGQEKWEFMTSKGNEAVAWDLGYLVGDCCTKLEKLGFKVKMTPD